MENIKFKVKAGDISILVDSYFEALQEVSQLKDWGFKIDEIDVSPVED